MFGLRKNDIDKISYFDSEASCGICNIDLSLKTLRSRFRLADGWLCNQCFRKAGGYSNIKRNKDTVASVKEKIENIQQVTPNSMQKYDNMRKNILYDENTDWGKRNIERDKIEHERFLLQEKYEKMIQKHYKYEENVEKNYKMAIYQDNIDNEYTETCKEQCELDIKLSESLIPYYEKDIELQNKAYNFGIVGLPIYSSYTRLIQIYEKKKDFLSAIRVCNIAIKNGYTNEGGNKTVIVRKARLENRLKKQIEMFNKKNNTNYKYYSDKNLIIDNNTGEIMK